MHTLRHSSLINEGKKMEDNKDDIDEWDMAILLLFLAKWKADRIW